MCWYCNKELIEPLTTYTRLHSKRKTKVEITVHSDCYKAFSKIRKQRRNKAPGSITQ